MDEVLRVVERGLGDGLAADAMGDGVGAEGEMRVRIDGRANRQVDWAGLRASADVSATSTHAGFRLGEVHPAVHIALVELGHGLRRQRG